MITDASNRLTTALLTLALACGLLWGTAGAADLEQLREQGSIRVAIADEVPYAYMDDGDAKGPGPDVARHVLGELGIDDIEWVVTSFSDLIPGLKEDRFDMVAAEMAIQPNRCEQVIYSEPNTTYGEGLLVAAGNEENIRSYEDFAKHNDLKVAVMADANQIDTLRALGVPESKIVTIQDNVNAIDAITSGEADAYAATSLTVSGLADRSNDVEVVFSFVDPVVDGDEVRSWGGFAFAKDSKDLRDAFNEVLVPYKYTREWEKTLRRYGFSKLDVLNSFKYDTGQLCDE